MKKNSILFFFASLILVLSSCSSTGSDLINPMANYPKTPGAFVKSKYLTGALKGTLKQDSTYYLTGNVGVNVGDTLAIQPGVTIIAQGNYQFQISGTLLSLGTEAKQVTMTSQDASRFTDFATYTGHWGGIVCDSSAHYVYLRYTHVNFTGGPDSGGSAQATFDFEGSAIDKGVNVVIEDCWFYGGIDDGIHLAGNITASVKRNVIQRLGGPDGETINIKTGVKGDISYNYIWSAANNSIKLNASTSVLTQSTKMNIYNNTIVDGSYRKKGEVVNSILIDSHASANIYNNIMVGNVAGINITRAMTSKTDKTTGAVTISYTGADTINCHYGNNLIYAPADSLTQYIYRVGAYSKKQSSDIIGTGTGLCNSVFTLWAAPTTSLPDMTILDVNVPSLKAGSPAIGAGISTLPYAYYISGTGHNGTADVVNKDMGAYPTDHTGNQHLPTQKPLN